MSYNAIAAAAQDADLTRRVAACIAQQTPNNLNDPQSMAQQRMWRICAEPGWGAAYASAQAANNPAPGSDPTVITDQMILAAVQDALGLIGEGTLPA